MTLAQYFEYHSSLKPKWKDKYISYKELREQVNYIRKLINQCPDVDFDLLLDLLRQLHDSPIAEMNNNNNNIEQQQQQPPQQQLMQPITPSKRVKKIDVIHAVENFLNMLTSDVNTAHEFYNQSIAEDEQVVRNLEARVREYDWQVRRVGLNKAKKTLQNDMVDLYRKIEFLYSYLHVNRLAIKYVLRKFADLFPEVVVQRRLPSDKTLFHVLETEFVSPKVFCDSTYVKELMERMENLYAGAFCSNDHHSAVNSLRAPREHHSHSDTFKFALNVGVTLPVILMCIVLWFSDPVTTSLPGFFGVLPVFRGTLLYILYTWLWGVNLYVFRTHRINHVFVFEFDPNDNLNHIKVFKTASVLTVIWTVYFFLYIGAAKHRITLIPIDVKYYPLALALTLIVIVIFPFHIFHLSARLTLLKVLGNLLITPFGKADFRECFVADILTSMVIPITDTMYMFCYFFSNTWFNDPLSNHNKCHDINRYAGPCLTFLPYAWRLLQCLRKYYETRVVSHLMNGLKYCSAIVVIVLNTLHVNLENEKDWAPLRFLWLGAVIFSTLFSFTWDIMMDWGLVAFGKKQSATSVANKNRRLSIIASTNNHTNNRSMDVDEEEEEEEEENRESHRAANQETTSLLSSTRVNSYSSESSVITPIADDYSPVLIEHQQLSAAPQQQESTNSPRPRGGNNSRRMSVVDKKTGKRIWRKVRPSTREKRFFSNHTYIIMSLFNFVARFAWAGTISTFFDTYKDFLKILFGSIELVRRCSWSVLRLEWAVVSNAEGYRRHTAVPLPVK